MAAGVIKKVIKKVIKTFKKPGYKKYNPKSKNIGINQARKEKLYTTVGKDIHGDINIINKGPLTGNRMPLDVPAYKNRRPWRGKDSGHTEVDPDNKWKGQSGGLVIKGKPKLAKRGWK